MGCVIVEGAGAITLESMHPEPKQVVLMPVRCLTQIATFWVHSVLIKDLIVATVVENKKANWCFSPGTYLCRIGSKKGWFSVNTTNTIPNDCVVNICTSN